MELISTDTTFSSPYFETWKEMPQEPKGHVVMEIFSVKQDYGTRYLPSTVASKNSSTAAWWYRYLDFRCGSLLMLLVAEVVTWLQARCVDCLRTRSAQDTIRVSTKCNGWLKAHNGNRGSTLSFSLSRHINLTSEFRTRRPIDITTSRCPGLIPRYYTFYYQITYRAPLRDRVWSGSCFNKRAYWWKWEKGLDIAWFWCGKDTFIYDPQK